MSHFNALNVSEPPFADAATPEVINLSSKKMGIPVFEVVLTNEDVNCSDYAALFRDMIQSVSIDVVNRRFSIRILIDENAEILSLLDDGWFGAPDSGKFVPMCIDIRIKNTHGEILYSKTLCGELTSSNFILDNTTSSPASISLTYEEVSPEDIQ